MISWDTTFAEETVYLLAITFIALLRTFLRNLEIFHSKTFPEQKQWTSSSFANFCGFSQQYRKGLIFFLFHLSSFLKKHLTRHDPKRRVRKAVLTAGSKNLDLFDLSVKLPLGRPDVAVVGRPLVRLIQRVRPLVFLPHPVHNEHDQKDKAQQQHHWTSDDTWGQNMVTTS